TLRPIATTDSAAKSLRGAASPRRGSWGAVVAPMRRAHHRPQEVPSPCAPNRSEDGAPAPADRAPTAPRRSELHDDWVIPRLPQPLGELLRERRRRERPEPERAPGEHRGVPSLREPRSGRRRRPPARERPQPDAEARAARLAVVSLGRRDDLPDHVPHDLRHRRDARHDDRGSLRRRAEPEAEELLRVPPEIARAEERDDELTAVVG